MLFNIVRIVLGLFCVGLSILFPIAYFLVASSSHNPRSTSQLLLIISCCVFVGYSLLKINKILNDKTKNNWIIYTTLFILTITKIFIILEIYTELQTKPELIFITIICLIFVVLLYVSIEIALRLKRLKSMKK